MSNNSGHPINNLSFEKKSWLGKVKLSIIAVHNPKAAYCSKDF